MKNLKQNLVKAILCLGVVSVSLVACQSDTVEDTDVITLDQLNDVIDDIDIDTTVIDEPANVVDSTQQDDVMVEPVVEEEEK